VKALKRFLSATPWKDYIERPFGDTANIATDADIEAYIRKETVSVIHPSATAHMSSRNSKTGVVGPDLLVKNTQGLRIVDASVFVGDNIINEKSALIESSPQPFVIAGHPQVGRRFQTTCTILISSPGCRLCRS
jgi:hypothetical protein